MTRSRHESSIVTNLEAFSQNTLYNSWEHLMSPPQMCEGLVKYVLAGSSRGSGSTNAGPCHVTPTSDYLPQQNSYEHMCRRENEKERREGQSTRVQLQIAESNVLWKERTTLPSRIARIFHIYMYMYVCMCSARCGEALMATTGFRDWI